MFFPQNQGFWGIWGEILGGSPSDPHIASEYPKFLRCSPDVQWWVSQITSDRYTTHEKVKVWKLYDSTSFWSVRPLLLTSQPLSKGIYHWKILKPSQAFTSDPSEPGNRLVRGPWRPWIFILVVEFLLDALTRSCQLNMKFNCLGRSGNVNSIALNILHKHSTLDRLIGNVEPAVCARCPEINWTPCYESLQDHTYDTTASTTTTTGSLHLEVGPVHYLMVYTPLTSYPGLVYNYFNVLKLCQHRPQIARGCKRCSWEALECFF